MQLKAARAMRKHWLISWVELVPRIELCHAGAYGRILTDGCRAGTLMTGARSNPPYIHLHMSFNPLCCHHRKSVKDATELSVAPLAYVGTAYCLLGRPTDNKGAFPKSTY